jgi:hypothetical protein
MNTTIIDGSSTTAKVFYTILTNISQSLLEDLTIQNGYARYGWGVRFFSAQNPS